MRAGTGPWTSLPLTCDSKASGGISFHRCMALPSSSHHTTYTYRIHVCTYCRTAEATYFLCVSLILQKPPGFSLAIYGVVNGQHGAGRAGLLPNVRFGDMEGFSVLAERKRKRFRYQKQSADTILIIETLAMVQHKVSEATPHRNAARGKTVRGMVWCCPPTRSSPRQRDLARIRHGCPDESKG